MKEILYVAAGSHIKPDVALPSAKIGVTANCADIRIRQLNSTKMPIRVELRGAWSFVGAAISAEDAEKAAHYLLAPYCVNGEWFEDPEGNLPDRVGKFAARLGGKRVTSGEPELEAMSTKQSKELAQMQRVFEPLAPRLKDLGVTWEYMTWKVGLDSPFGRLNISVRRSGELYIRMTCKELTAAELSGRTSLSWKKGVRDICLVTTTADGLLKFLAAAR